MITTIQDLNPSNITVIEDMSTGSQTVIENLNNSTVTELDSNATFVIDMPQELDFDALVASTLFGV